jgi:hypothetical protein
MKHRIQLSLLMLLLSATAFAQQITVKKFGQATQFIQASDQIRDWDNELCALVKIQGAKIDSVSGAFEVRRFAAEVWAYMTNGDRKLTIYKQGYEPKEVVFKEFGVDDVKSNKVYLLTIFAPDLAKQKLFIELSGGINFTTAGELGAGHSDNSKWMTEFNVGVRARYMFTDLIGASVGIFFATKGYKYSDNEFQDEKGDFSFVDIPVQALLNFDLTDALALQVLAGPCFSINVGGKMTRYNPYANQKFGDIYSSFQLGGQGDIRLVIAKHYAIGAGYQMGFGNYKSYNFGVNVGYIF